METKICSRCNIEKSIDQFYKSKYTKYKKTSWCKNCHSLQKVEYRRTKEGLVKMIFLAQKGSSKKRGHSKPDYSLKELEVWCFNQELFYTLYNNWVDSKYEKMLKPSIDRINNYEHYYFDNIVLTTWKENRENLSKDLKSGKFQIKKNIHKPVNQYDLNNVFINSFVSVNDAARQLKIDESHIRRMLKGERKTCGGFIWKYKT